MTCSAAHTSVDASPLSNLAPSVQKRCVCYSTRLNNNIYAPRWKRLLFFADYMATQPMPVAMGVPVQAVASPSPIPTAVPLGGAVPVAMPVSTAAANAVAPTPMSMQASASGIWRFPCSADKYEQLKAMTRADAPYALASRGMTREQWAHCTDALEAVHDASFFKNCPFAQCCYWCVPFGPLQAFLCLFNPISCVFCIQPVERAKRACIAQCTPILRPLGYKVSVRDWALDEPVIFEPA